jgi:hypothetical protein
VGEHRAAIRNGFRKLLVAIGRDRGACSAPRGLGILRASSEADRCAARLADGGPRLWTGARRHSSGDDRIVAIALEIGVDAITGYGYLAECGLRGSAPKRGLRAIGPRPRDPRDGLSSSRGDGGSRVPVVPGSPAHLPADAPAAPALRFQ